MRPLSDVRPTPEQLAIVSRNKPAIEVIRGAAGSGKTTTALLRLRSLIGMFVNRRKRQHREEPVRILVLTFNRTLRGYIDALARQQVSEGEGIDLEISTFSKWAVRNLGKPVNVNAGLCRSKIKSLGAGIKLPSDFLVEEVEYAMGRFLPDKLVDYLTVRRDGRGAVPRVEKPLRESILNDVIRPYQEWKSSQNVNDWNDLAVHFALVRIESPYDIIIADETQDFSANQIRAINNQLADIHSLTFVVDTAQRIYARGFTWHEAGIIVRPENSKRLERNYRNTVEIAKFAEPLVRGMPFDDDATMPDFSKCDKSGPKPIVLKGKYCKQLAFIVDHIKSTIDLSKESVAILHPLGWFRDAQIAFSHAGLDYIEITRESEWPEGDENIAFSTLHSAKGLEFDHVMIIGLNAEVTAHGEEDEDDKLTMLRRLLAMGISRARISVILGYKPQDASRLVTYLDPATYKEVQV